MGKTKELKEFLDIFLREDMYSDDLWVYLGRGIYRLREDALVREISERIKEISG